MGTAAPGVTGPGVKDVAYWMTRCYRDGCENVPARQQSPRFRGKYCAPCLERLLRENQTP